MKIGLLGFGKTGSRVAEVLASDPTVDLEWIATKSGQSESSVPRNLNSQGELRDSQLVTLERVTDRGWLEQNFVDVIVDFSNLHALEQYGEMAAQNGIRIVTCVSAYQSEQHELILRLARKTAILWSPNITLGINFLLMSAKAIKSAMPSADVHVTEEHFREKPEVSGTAVKIANELGADTAAINMIRAGGILGVHEVLFGYDNEILRLRHESINRKAFGDGALFAAKSLVAKPKGLYRMEDLLAPYFREAEHPTGLLKRLLSRLGAKPD